MRPTDETETGAAATAGRAHGDGAVRTGAGWPHAGRDAAGVSCDAAGVDGDEGRAGAHDAAGVARDAAGVRDHVGVRDDAEAARDAAVRAAADGGSAHTERTAAVDASSRAVGPLSAYGDGALTVTQGADLLDEMDRQLAQVNRVYADLIVTVGRLARGGIIETLEGMTLDHFLAVAHRVTGAEVWMLETAARVLETMPATWCWFREGRISWSGAAPHRVRRPQAQPRRARHPGPAHRRLRPPAGAMGAEAFTDAIDRAVDELRGERNVERAEQREQRSHTPRPPLAPDPQLAAHPQR